MVHSRIIDLDGAKTTLSFGHEGVLYRQSFIMYDKKTDSKWNHSTGLAMAGKLAGRRLELMPSWVVRWAKWKEMHPNTRVLAREGRGGFMGTFVADREFGSFGISVGQGPRAKLYSYDLLAERPVVNDEVTPFSVVVVFDPRHKEAMAFSRKIDDRVLSFEAVSQPRGNLLLMRDRDTGSLWDRFTGKAIDGPLRGKAILPLVSVPWLKERWRQIYPEGIVFQSRR